MSASGAATISTTASVRPRRLRAFPYVVRLARYWPWLYLVSSTAITLFYLLPLVSGLLVRRFFDLLSGDAPAGFWGMGTTEDSAVWTLAALLMGWSVVRVIQLAGGTASEVTLNYVHAALMQRNLFERILSRPGARAVPASPGEAVSRFRDDTQAVARFVTWSADPLGQTLLAVVALAVLVRINPLISLAVFVPLLAMVVVINVATRRIRHYRRANQEAIGGVTDLLGEIFGAVQAVKIAGAERRVVDHLRSRNEARRRATLDDVVFTRLLASVSSNAANLGTGFVLLLAGQAMSQGRFTVGDFALFLFYLGWLTQMTGLFADLSTQYKQIGVSLERLDLLLQGDDPRQHVPPLTLAAHHPLYLRGALPEMTLPPRRASDRLDWLEARGLTFRYPGAARPAIEDVNLTIRRGEFVVVTGRIGAGKTTLLRLLLGLLPLDSGEICWNGVPVADPASCMVVPRAAYTPQVPRLFSETLRDNILLGLPPDEVDITQALRLAALDRDLRTGGDADPSPGRAPSTRAESVQSSARVRNAYAFRRGTSPRPTAAGSSPSLTLDTVVGPRGVRLSGGQLQRAAAARMFVRDAELLMVDDLSSALDVETERTLWSRLLLPLPLGEGRGGGSHHTILAVSHRRMALRCADRILVLKEGQVEAQGELDALLDTCAEMRHLWQADADHAATLPVPPGGPDGTGSVERG